MKLYNKILVLLNDMDLLSTKKHSVKLYSNRTCELYYGDKLMRKFETLKDLKNFCIDILTIQTGDYT